MSLFKLQIVIRPVHILLFLMLIWLCSVFEADFHTEPKTKTFFLFGWKIFMLHNDIRPPLLEINEFFTLKGAVFNYT